MSSGCGINRNKTKLSNIPTIDPRYTCDGGNEPPDLKWNNGFPKETKSLALIMCDPDAPNPPFFHWVIQYLPPTTKAINPSIFKTAKFGLNSMDTTAYFGPCPPKTANHPHRYYVNIYALDESYKELSPLPAEEFLHKIRYDVLEKRTVFLKTYKRRVK